MALSKPSRAELMTTDAEAAVAFYGEVFGWRASAEELPDDQCYYRLRDRRGRDVGGLYAMTEDLRKQGVSAHWTPELEVADAAAAARLARSLGGRVSLDGFDLLGLGRLALVQDPTGAPLGLWEPAARTQEPAPFWLELSTPDQAAAARFYAGLCGWETAAEDGGDRAYTTFQVADETVAGMLALTGRFAAVPAHWIIYLPVADFSEVVAKVEMTGGRVLAPPHTLQGFGRQAVIADPGGAVLGITDLRL